jgi:hypothetical protein
MTTHPEIDLVSPFLDGELDDAARAAFEAHLAGCAECSAALAAIRATVGDLKLLGEAEMPEQASWAVRAGVAKARKRGARATRIAIATGSVAALLAGITAAVVHKPATNTSAANAPGPAAVQMADAPAIQTSDANYDASNARDVFDLAGGARTQDSAGAASGGPAYPASAPMATSPKRAAPEAMAPLSFEGFQTCVDRVRAGAHETARPVLYLVARYEGAQAFFMVFDVPADAPAREELWIVRPGTCAVLRLEQRKI